MDDLILHAGSIFFVKGLGAKCHRQNPCNPGHITPHGPTVGSLRSNLSFPAFYGGRTIPSLRAAAFFAGTIGHKCAFVGLLTADWDYRPKNGRSVADVG